MKGKVFKAIGVLLFLSLVIIACTAPKPEGPTTTEEWPDLTDLGGREIIIAEGNDTPPFCFIDTATGKPTGFDYEFFEALCKRANCKPVFKEFAWDGIFEAAVAGEWDITIWGIALTKERAKIVDFADPIVEYYHALVVRSDSEFTDVDSFVNSDARIAAVPGSAEEINAIKFVGEERIHHYETFDLPPLAVMAGDVEGFISVNFPLVIIMNENPGKFKVLGETTSPSLIAPPMRPGSPIQTAVNAAINEMWADGTMETLQKKWGLMPQE